MKFAPMKLLVAPIASIPVIMNQPVTHDMPLAMLGGANTATQEYCPPATGYAEQISAME